MSLFLGIDFLATHSRVAATEEESAPSQLAAPGDERGSAYYWARTFAMLILLLAASTGYQGFPRLSAFLARDGMLPRWLQSRGDCPVYSPGATVLAVLSTPIVVAFGADEI